MCQADAVEQSPSEQTQRDTCNFGYGRRCCSWFPSGGEIDAVRFSVLREADGVVTVQYILERDYSPASHGTFESHDGVIPADVPEPIARQAAAFIRAYGDRRLRA